MGSYFTIYQKQTKPDNRVHITYKIFIILILQLGISGHACSQLKAISDSGKSIESHSPQKALIYSLICPGLGQAYNGKYWKLPILYSAGTTLAYGFTYNQLKYKKFKDAVFGKESTNGEYLIDGRYYEEKIIFTGMRFYERRRDICLIAFGTLYLLNVIDAMVDAYFFRFDVSEDLSMRLEPLVTEGSEFGASIGFRINLNF